MLTTPIERVCLNFRSRCNMGCGFCYIPFATSNESLATLLKIADRCHALGAKVVTLGGGDPFQFPDLEAVVERFSTYGIEVHIDTNGIEAHEARVQTVAQVISLIAFPLDGASSSTHDALRTYPGHFNIVLQRIREAKAMGLRVKVNSVVTKQNANEMSDISTLIQELGANLWSLYQFWPLERGRRRRSRYQISDAEYNDTMKTVTTTTPQALIEANLVESRVGSYFFVSQDGQAYTHAPGDPESYVFLGSVLEDEPILRWYALVGTSLRAASRARYHATAN